MSKFDKYKSPKNIDQLSSQKSSVFDKYRNPKLVDGVNEPTILESGIDKAKKFGQGLAYGVGSTADTVNKYIAAPVTDLAATGIKKTGELLTGVGLDGVGGAVTTLGDKTQQLSQSYENSNAAENYPKMEFLQTNNNSSNTIYEDLAYGAGIGAEAILPWNLATKGLKALTGVAGIAKAPWVSKINNFLATPLSVKNTATFAGAGAGGEVAKSNNPDTSEIENIARETAGSIFGALTVQAGMNSLGAKVAKVFFEPNKYITSPIKTYKEGKFIQKYGGEINKDVVAAAEKLNLPLTPELISNNPNALFLANNKLRSEFVDASYKELNKNLNDKIIKSLEDNVLENIGAKIEGSTTESAASIASQKAKETINANVAKWNKESTALYDTAKAIAPDEKITPSKTLNKVDDLISELSYGSKDINTPKADVRRKLENFKQEVSNGIGIRDLLGWKQDLYDLGANNQSYKSLLSSVAKQIDEEISNYAFSNKSTKAFTEAWKQATDYNREMIQNIVKTDAVRSILQKETPIEAVKYMTSKQTVNDVAKMIDNPELMNSLKRTAFEKQLYDRNIITTDGALNAKQLEKFLVKEQDFAISLLGEKRYSILKNDFLPYLKQRNAGIKNTSGTSYITRDSELQRASENLIPYTLWGATAGLGATQSIKGAIGGAAAGAVSGVKARMEIKAIKELSQMAANPRIMREIIAKGNNPKAESNLLNNPAVKAQGITGAAKLINNNVEENKNKPKAPAFNKTIEDMYNNKYIRNFIEAD